MEQMIVERIKILKEHSKAEYPNKPVRLSVRCRHYLSKHSY